MKNEYNTLELRVLMQRNSDCYQYQNNVTNILKICLIWNSFGVCFGGIRVTHLFTFHVLCFCFVCLRPVSCLPMQCCRYLWTVNYRLPLYLFKRNKLVNDASC